MLSMKNITDLKEEINLERVATLGKRLKDMSQKQGVKSASWLVAGLAIGSVLTLYLDPQEGKRRRTQVKDRAVSMGRNVQEATRRRIKDLNDRVRGVVSQAGDVIQDNVENVENVEKRA